MAGILCCGQTATTSSMKRRSFLDSAAANRLSSVTDWNSRAVAYTYDDANRMTLATLPASTGIVSSYSYDNACGLSQAVRRAAH